MKVKIGPHPNWIGPYQIADALCWWVPEVADDYGVSSKPDWVHNFGTWLSENKSGEDSWLTRLCQWIHDRRKRQVYIHIDPYDAWNADHTLSLIAVPLLKQLKATKHGGPHVDDCDVPEHLRSTAAPPKANEYDIDELWFDRWEWVLDEMIWAHTQEISETPETDSCWQHGVPDANWPYPSHDTGFESMLSSIKCDWDKLKQLEDRKQNGFRLFGKYYQALWD